MMFSWEEFSVLEKIFLFIALPATLILVIQMIMQIFGFGNESAEGLEADMSSDVPGSESAYADASEISSSLSALRIFTFQGIVAFFAISGWVGLLLLMVEVHPVISIIVAFVAGTTAMILLSLIFRAMMKLQSSGNIVLSKTIGLPAQVYLKVPAKGKGSGKVTVLIQERFREYDAITDALEDIPSGVQVTITGIVSGSTLKVEKYK
jgi:hypothetical protein